MKKNLSAFVLALLMSASFGLSLPSKAGALILPWKKEHLDALRVFQFLNYLDFGLAEAINTGDSLVLAGQYDTLAGNLDLSAVKDEQIIGVMEALGKLVDRAEAERLSNEADRIFSDRLTDAIYRSLSPGTSITRAIWTETARHGATWYDYRRHRPLYNGRMRGKIALTEGQTRELTRLRQDMLRISWELSGKYGIDKIERPGREDMDRFVSIIECGDPVLRSRQLKRLLRDRPAFRSFPPFWFYSAMAWTEAPDQDGAFGIICLDRYDDAYRGIFKKDPMTAMAAMVRLTLTSRENAGQRVRSLETVKSNCDASDWQYYLLAAMAESELGLVSQAREDLLRNIDNGYQVSLSARTLAWALLKSGSPEKFHAAMAVLLKDGRVKAGEIISLASLCSAEECKAWLDTEMNKMTLTLAGAESKCARIEIPSAWIDFPCSMDIEAVWSRDAPGWKASLPPTALAVLPKPEDSSQNRLIETPVLDGDPGLPPDLETLITHPLFRIEAKWKLIPPEDGIKRNLLMGLGRAFPFYRPEAGKYKLAGYSVGVR